MKLPPLFMVFDVESVGLHGEGFAVGFVVVNRDGQILAQGEAACHPQYAHGTRENLLWVSEHVSHPHTHLRPVAVREWFWNHWRTWAEKDAVLVADCAWPVEARFLAACVNDAAKQREWSGPYPLHEIASFALIAGADPLAKEVRAPEDLPEHNALHDARHSARQLLHYLDVIERRNGQHPTQQG